jgi:hypothetical protein
MTMRSDVCQLFPGRTNGGEGEEARRPATPRRRRRPRLARANAAAGGRESRSVERIGARRRPEAALGRQLARPQHRRRHGRPSRLCLRQRDMTCHFAAPPWPGSLRKSEACGRLSLRWRLGSWVPKGAWYGQGATEVRKTPGCERPLQASREESALTPGSGLPSSSSREAPPPVETWLSLSSLPALATRVAVSLRREGWPGVGQQF